MAPFLLISKPIVVCVIFILSFSSTIDGAIFLVKATHHHHLNMKQRLCWRVVGGTGGVPIETIPQVIVSGLV